MDANNSQEIKFTSEVDDDLDQDKRAALQADAYDGTVPPRPSSTVNLGNLELIQTGPVTGPIEPKPSCPSSAEESSRPRPSGSTTGPSRPDGESIVLSGSRQAVTQEESAASGPSKPGAGSIIVPANERPVDPKQESADGQATVESESPLGKRIADSNDDFRRTGPQEMLRLDKAEKLFEAVKTNEIYKIVESLQDLHFHPECIDFVRDYLQKQLGLKRDEVQIVFNRDKNGYPSLQLELCKIDWPLEGERRLPSGTRLIIGSDYSTSGFSFEGGGWSTMNAKEALKSFYTAKTPPKPANPVNEPPTVVQDFPLSIYRPGDSKH